MIAARHPETAGFHEVRVRAEVATCERRDPKGLYARAGFIPEFTGITAPYELPESPELVIDTITAGVAQSASQPLDSIKPQFALGAN